MRGVTSHKPDYFQELPHDDQPAYRMMEVGAYASYGALKSREINTPRHLSNLQIRRQEYLRKISVFPSEGAGSHPSVTY